MGAFLAILEVMCSKAPLICFLSVMCMILCAAILGMVIFAYFAFRKMTKNGQVRMITIDQDKEVRCNGKKTLTEACVQDIVTEAIVVHKQICAKDFEQISDSLDRHDVKLDKYDGWLQKIDKTMAILSTQFTDFKESFK